MTFEEWMEDYFAEDADWDEGCNRGNMSAAFHAGRTQTCKSCADFEHLFELQWKRSQEAIKHWQKENDPEVHPDLGHLLEWLMKKAGLK